MNYYTYIHTFPWHIIVGRFPSFQVPVMALVCKAINEDLKIAQRNIHSLSISYTVQSPKLLNRAIFPLGFPKNDARICKKARELKKIPTLIRAIKIECSFDVRKCWIFAIENGSIDLLESIKKYYFKQFLSDDYRSVYGVGSCGWAAWHNHLGVIKWLRSNGFPCNSTTCLYAAKAGHLHILKWLRSQKPPCPWDSNVCSRAASYGDLNILKWLRSQDPPCPWDYGTVLFAKGNNDMINWLLMQNPPCPLPPTYLLDEYLLDKLAN